MVEGEIDYDARVAERIFSCTMCGSCTTHCFKFIDLRSIYQAMREDMAAKDLTPAGLKQAAIDTYDLHNPFGKPDGDRLRWLKDTSHLDRKAKTALFIGCTPSYARRSAAQDAIDVLDKLGIDYTISSQEWCCGHPLMSAGEREKAAELMRHNLQVYRDLGVERMIFACPGCQMTFAKDLTEVLGQPAPFEMMHLVEVVAAEIRAGRAEMAAMPPGSVLTYHDPCTLGRQLGVYDAPRQVIKSIPGMRFAEMPRHGRDSFCCGAGSYVRYDFPELTDTAGLERWKEAQSTGAGILLTACTSCLSEFQQVRAQTKDRMEVMDLIGLVNRLIQVKALALA